MKTINSELEVSLTEEDILRSTQASNRSFLKFDGLMEAQYQEARHCRLVQRVPMIGFSGLLIFCVFFALDILFLPQHIYAVTIAIRLFVVCPMIAFVIFGVYKQWPQKQFNVFYVLSYLVCGLSVVVILFTARKYDIYLPFDGLLLHLVFGYFLMAMPFYNVVIASFIISISYFSVELYLDQSFEQLSYDAIFMLTVNLMGAVGSYIQENSRRKLFVKEKLIELNIEKDAREIASKTKLVATASHDLRQPLNAMNLLAETLESKIVDLDALAITHKLQDSILHLNQLLGSLLNISQLDVGIVAPRTAPLELGRLIRSIVDEQGPRANQMSITLSVASSEEIFVKTDPLLFSRVLRNLLQNSLDHAQATSIQIDWAISNDVVRLSIEDNGVGIPENERLAIFEEFHQLGNSPKQGMGLGLAIVSQLCELLGIRVGVDGKFGEGCCFWLELELTKERQTILPGASACDALGTQQLIFIVEDDTNILEPMIELLSDWGYQVQGFESPHSVLAELEQSIPDLIVSDYGFPEDTNGLELISTINERVGREIPALLITADTMNDFSVEISKLFPPMQNRPIQVLFKPVLPAKLRLLIRHYLEDSH